MFCSQDADADKMFGVSAPKDGAPDTRYVQVHGTENTGKISAFAAFQPGIARVFEVLFEQDDATPRVLPLRGESIYSHFHTGN